MTAANTIDREAVQKLVLEMETPLLEAKNLALAVKFLSLVDDEHPAAHEREAISEVASCCRHRLEAIDGLWGQLREAISGGPAPIATDQA